MYQLMFDNGADAPIVTETKLSEPDALWWAARSRELQPECVINIIHEATDWLTECPRVDVGAEEV